MTEQTQNYVDLGVTLPVRKHANTTAIEIGIFYERKEIDVPGYQRCQLQMVRTTFAPTNGEVVLEMQGLKFGEVQADVLPLNVEAVGMFARGELFGLKAHHVIIKSTKLEIVRFHWMNIKVVQ